MRQRNDQNKKTDGPLGIRTVVWLVVLGLVLACLLTIHVSRHETGASADKIVSEQLEGQRSSPGPQAQFRRTAYRRITPDVYESEARYDNEEAQFSMVEQMLQDRRTWMDNPD